MKTKFPDAFFNAVAQAEREREAKAYHDHVAILEAIKEVYELRIMVSIDSENPDID